MKTKDLTQREKLVRFHGILTGIQIGIVLGLIIGVVVAYSNGVYDN